MWLLLATSIIALAFIFERLIVFLQCRQDFYHVVGVIEPLITNGIWEKAEKWCNGHNGPFAAMIIIYLRYRDEPTEVREDLLRRQGLLIIAHLDQHLRLLAMIAQVSTLLGLLGTFNVMIVRFAQGQAVGGQTANFSSAIWQALLTTMYGLLIAIPCSAIYQILEARVDAIARNLDILASYLDEWRREADKRSDRPTKGQS